MSGCFSDDGDGGFVIRKTSADGFFTARGLDKDPLLGRKTTRGRKTNTTKWKDIYPLFGLVHAV